MSDYATVEQRTYGLLQEILGTVDPPTDGAWMFSFKTIQLGVAVRGDEDPTVTVFTRVVENVPKTPELLDCLNDINEQMSFGRIYWGGNAVYIQQVLIGSTLDREELHVAMSSVGEWGDSLDEDLAQRFGSLAQSLGGTSPPGPPPPGVVSTA
jgi:hypothetical protein